MNASAASELLLTSAREGVDHIKARELLYQPSSSYQQDFDADVFVATQGDTLMQLLQHQARQQQIDQEKRRHNLRRRLEQISRGEVGLSEMSSSESESQSQSQSESQNISKSSRMVIDNQDTSSADSPPPPPASPTSSPSSVASISATYSPMRRDSLQSFVQGIPPPHPAASETSNSKQSNADVNQGSSSATQQHEFTIGASVGAISSSVPWWIIQ